MKPFVVLLCLACLAGPAQARTSLTEIDRKLDGVAEGVNNNGNSVDGVASDVRAIDGELDDVRNALGDNAGRIDRSAATTQAQLREATEQLGNAIAAFSNRTGGDFSRTQGDIAALQRALENLQVDVDLSGLSQQIDNLRVQELQQVLADLGDIQFALQNLGQTDVSALQSQLSAVGLTVQQIENDTDLLPAVLQTLEAVRLDDIQRVLVAIDGLAQNVSSLQTIQQDLGLVQSNVVDVLIAIEALAAQPADGVVALNQQVAIDGLDDGDPGGFPIVISQPGSYRLTSNLLNDDANVDVILVDASHVSIDLNGFSIIGPTSCTLSSISGLTCINEGDGAGVTLNDRTHYTKVFNGAISGMGNGVLFDARLSRGHHIRDVSISDASSIGIDLGSYSVADRVAIDSSNVGIVMGRSTVSNASLNTLVGSVCGGVITNSSFHWPTTSGSALISRGECLLVANGFFGEGTVVDRSNESPNSVVGRTRGFNNWFPYISSSDDSLPIGIGDSGHNACGAESECGEP